MSILHPAIAVVGPTASGKSRLGIVLAREFQGEIVNCDALQVYRRMDVGTAKIPFEEREGIPHHLLDAREPDKEFSAGDYQRRARAIIRDITARRRLPVIVGGSGFYLRALIDGLFDGPERSEKLRARMRAIIQRKGAGLLHRALNRVDPDSAARIAENDADRIIRAYEIYIVSGKTMTWWQQQPRDAFQGYRWLKIGMTLPREQLYRRINLRVEKMFQCGLLEETRRLLDQYPAACPAFKAIGYRQAAAYLTGSSSLEQAIESTQQESRRYAKRQLTWFRADKDVLWFPWNEQDLACLDAMTSCAQTTQIVETVRQFLYRT